MNRPGISPQAGAARHRRLHSDQHRATSSPKIQPENPLKFSWSFLFLQNSCLKPWSCFILSDPPSSPTNSLDSAWQQAAQKCATWPLTDRALLWSPSLIEFSSVFHDPPCQLAHCPVLGCSSVLSLLPWRWPTNDTHTHTRTVLVPSRHRPWGRKRVKN